MKYKFLISLITSLSTAICLNAQNAEPTDSLTRELQEIVVTAKQPATKLIGTTLVSTIAGSNLAEIGNALDVLAQLPMMKIQDNSVVVIGRNNILIYIDGRPMRDDFELEQLLSSNLKKVELLMSPGAMYDASVGAVLKITTRHNFLQGLSLNNQLQNQLRRRWSVRDILGLSYRIGNWDIYLNGIFNHNNQLIKGSTINTLSYERKETIIGSSQHNLIPTNTGTIQSGFNYAKEDQSFGAYYRYSPEQGDFENHGSEWIDSEQPLPRDISKTIRAHGHFVSVYYENKFADRYLLHFDGNFKQSKATNHVSTTYPEAVTDNVNSTDYRHSSLWADKLYLNFPLAKGDFTVGTQDSYTQTRLNYIMHNASASQYIPSTLTEARQTSASIFASWSRIFGKLSLTAGARYEYVDYILDVNGKRDKNVSSRDHLLTPDISLGYSFNDRTQISLSYKMSTVKPPYSQLTGSLSYVGRHEIEGGNPGLRDGRMHDFQIFGMWNDFILQANLTSDKDTYAYVKQLYPADNLQLLMHPINVDVTAFSMYLVWNRPIRRWTPNITLGVYKQWLDIAGTTYNRPIFSYYFDNTLTLPKGWTFTANITGQGRGDMHTNRFGTTWFTMDASVGKTLFNKSLIVKLSATDIFNTANNDWTMNTFGVRVDKRQSYDHRGLTLNVIYRFQPRQSKYKGQDASEEEMKRL